MSWWEDSWADTCPYLREDPETGKIECVPCRKRDLECSAQEEREDAMNIAIKEDEARLRAEREAHEEREAEMMKAIKEEEQTTNKANASATGKETSETTDSTDLLAAKEVAEATDAVLAKLEKSEQPKPKKQKVESAEKKDD